MPFYEYQCKACDAHHEAMQKMSDAPLRKCPACGRNQLVRLISAPVFRLKGGGWYETDFKSDQEQKRNLVEREEKAEKKDAAAEGGAEKKESKPESATESKPESKPATTESKPAKSGAAKPVPGSLAKSKPKNPSAVRPKAKTGRPAASRPAGRAARR